MRNCVETDVQIETENTLANQYATSPTIWCPLIFFINRKIDGFCFSKKLKSCNFERLREFDSG